MQEQVSKKPLVDILSEMMGSQVVMRADEYVYLENKIVVSQSEIDEAVATQSALYGKSIQQSCLKAVDDHLNSKAKERGYDDIKTVVTYADEPSVPAFQTEGQAFRSWRSLVYDYMYKEFEKVENGQRVMPTVEGLIDELPVLGL